MRLPQDGHVHSQFSWDAWEGDVRATCARAVDLGLASLAFTEHVDLTPWARAASGRALEVNTTLPLSPLVVDWWHEAGGQAVVFGSDAHRPEDVARDFAGTAAVVEAHGYRPGATPYEHWGRA